MHVRNALDQLKVIHDQLTRSEVYRGFHVPSVATVGVLAFLSAALQKFIPDSLTPSGFVKFWLAIAGIGWLLGTASAVRLYSMREDSFARRRSRRVLAQFSPCILVGATVTVAVARVPEFVAFLPGLWGTIFGLGIIAARPHLPAGIGLVGVWYVGAGATLLLLTKPNDDPSGWAMGLVFGVGHLLTALVLWRDVEEVNYGS
jgi:hypothetical protein